MNAARAKDVLDFWFGDSASVAFGQLREPWFKKEPAFDEEIRQRFHGLYEDAARGACDGWTERPKDCLALVLVFDQFPRNMFRDSARAFATDAAALATARRAISCGDDRVLVPVERVFLYLPFEHSENLEDQRRSVALFESMPDHPKKAEWIDYATRHLVIVERFGRFPHRNRALGRASTAEETEFLKQPNSRF